MDLWNLINDNLNKKGLKKTNLYEKMKDTFEYTEYEVSGYKAFLKRFESSKMTVEELFQMSYILDINIGEIQEVFNTHVKSLVNLKRMMDINQLNIIKESSKYYDIGDYCQVIDYNDIPSELKTGTHYFMNFNYHKDVISLELVDVKGGIIITLGYIKEASKFINRKFGNLDKFRTLDKVEKLRIILDRIDLENNIYGEREFKTRILLQNNIQKILELPFNEFKQNQDNGSWTYKDENILFDNKYLTKNDFVGSLEYSSLIDEYKNKEREIFNIVNFERNQILTIYELHGIAAMLQFSAKDNTINALIGDSTNILYSNKWYSIESVTILNINPYHFTEEDYINLKIVEIKDTLYNIMKDRLKNKGFKDIPETIGEARTLDYFLERELIPIKEILKNACYFKSAEQELSKFRESIERRKNQLKSELGACVKILNKKKEVLFRLESSPIAVDIVYQGRGSDISSSDYRIFAVTYIKLFESEVPTFLRRRRDYGIWDNTDFEKRDEICIYDTTTPESYENFNYDSIPEIAFNIVKKCIKSFI